MRISDWSSDVCSSDVCSSDLGVGDDDPSETGAFVAERLKALSDSGVPVALMHGNRDFLLGEAYAQRAGMRLLEDPTRIELNGKPVLLMHGDTLCTDDVAYQRFRAQTRDPAWQAQDRKSTSLNSSH